VKKGSKTRCTVSGVIVPPSSTIAVTVPSRSLEPGGWFRPRHGVDRVEDQVANTSRSWGRCPGPTRR
jgi:hypothetical protein